MRSQKARSCYHRGHGQKIAEYLPNYYGGAYKLETSENENQDMPGFIQEYTERIRTSNEEQGKNGVYFGHGTREIATVRTILLKNELDMMQVLWTCSYL